MAIPETDTIKGLLPSLEHFVGRNRSHLRTLSAPLGRVKWCVRCCRAPERGARFPPGFRFRGPLRLLARPRWLNGGD
jgi:hypothetical protein